MNRSLKIIWINIFAIILVLIDQFSKYFILKNPDIFRDFSVLGFLNIRLSRNYNLAFNIKIPYFFLYSLIALAFLLLFFLLIKSYKEKKYLNVFILTIILAGAASNLTDRILLGYVVDFINIPLFTTFNPADIYITLGIAYLTIKELF